MRLKLITCLLSIIISFTMPAAGNESVQGNPERSRVIWKVVPGVAGLAATSFIIDGHVTGFLRSNQTPFLDSSATLTDMAGEKKIVIPAVLFTYGTARFILKDEKLQSATLNSIQSVIVTAIATEGIKIITGRARPFNDEGPYAFRPFPGREDRYKSLPSGHASLAFALFTPYAETYSRWIYLVPASVAMGRVYQDKHWLSDVVMGGGIGLVSGLLFTRYENIHIIPNGLRIYF
jgi:membrane-associated phospholipid phosphatase